MARLTWPIGVLLLGLSVLGAGPSRGQDDAATLPHGDQHGHDHGSDSGEPVLAESISLKLPDASLVDQDGRRVRLLSDVVEDKVVLASFVYTSCSTVCPVVSTLFSQVQDKLGTLLGSQVRLVTLSVDPARDTPGRLKTYAARHGARAGWIWLTGKTAEVTETLKGFGTYTADYRDHPVVILIGDGRTGKWIRHYGFQDPERLAAEIRNVLAERDQHAGGTHDARTYFTDTELLDQHGRRLRFYSDVLKDRVVLINSIYTHCEDACPLITRKLAQVRAQLGERFGKELRFVSISTDPERDSPQALKKFAHAQGADEAGWIFLTGNKPDIDRVLARLGQLPESLEAHSTLLIAGNVAARRWSKIRPDAPVPAITARLQLLAAKP